MAARRRRSAKVIIFRTIAIICFALVLLVMAGAASIFLNPRSRVDIPKLVSRLVMMFFAALVGTVLWLSTTPKRLREKQFYGLMTGVTSIYAVTLLAILFGTLDIYMRAESMNTAYNLVPFRTIAEFVGAYWDGSIRRWVVVENLVGNLILFAPFGAILPFYLKEFRKTKWFLVALFSGLIVTEVLQHVTSRGCMDIDDVILNSIGAIIVFFLLWNKRAEQMWLDLGIIT